jgi:Cu+-exporting ATPase
MNPALKSIAKAPTIAAQAQAVAEPVCFHCGTPCGGVAVRHGGKSFCCHGCLTVFELLSESGLSHFYDLGKQAGIRVKAVARADQFQHLDDPAVAERLLDFSDGRISRVTLRVPAIHCIACVWLLENLFRLHPAIGRSEVNFPKREVAIAFDPARLKLSGLVALLGSLGYEPVLNLADLGRRTASPVRRRLWLQVGIAGFAFGNVMMLSFPGYLGLAGESSPALRMFLGVVSLALALPVLLYSAADYWRSAWTCVRQRILTIELPIAVGLAALFAQSAYEILRGLGPGYLDSLSGLIFFLLCGRLFQQKTYDRLSFDRDYKSFFPLSVVRLRPRSSAPGSSGVGGSRTKDENEDEDESAEETVALARLRVGDRLRLRHGELIPADARLVSGQGIIDYSFVTGESEPVTRKPGDYLYAGGQQTGGSIEVEIVKPVSQSYLASLWSHAAFAKGRADTLNNLTNRLSRWFVAGVALIALATAAYWLAQSAGLAWRAATAVLIVACPCALALAAPFALGTAQRWLARQNIFLKNPQVLETLARVDAIVFDKTGTLTTPRRAAARWEGEPLSAEEASWVGALAQHSTHPLARQIRVTLPEPLTPALSLLDGEREDPRRLAPETGCLGGSEHPADSEIPGTGGLETCATMATCATFKEYPGQGLEGDVAGREVWLGSAAWLAARGVAVPQGARAGGASVHLAIDGVYRGHYVLRNVLRPRTEDLIGGLASRYALALLSGDNARERETFHALFGERASLHFNQTPLGKLDFIRDLQQTGQTTMMVGDGLNDAGALRQSDVGVAVVEQIGAFSPASDVILEADTVQRLPALLRFARQAVGVVYASFAISVIYNVVGIGFAARGLLSPLVAAVLMPLSSVSVVAFACGATTWLARRGELGGREPGGAET